MKLADLKTNVEETLGLDVISFKSLLVCVNNCISILHTKEYRSFVEAEFPIVDKTYPVSITTPTNLMQILYVKIKTTDGIFLIERVSLSQPGLQSRKVGDVYRVNGTSGTTVYYEKLGKIYIDTMNDSMVIEEVILGYYKTIDKLSLTLSETGLFGDAESDPVVEQIEIDVREDFEEAFTWYGLQFYSTRFKFRPEQTKEFNNTFKYFIEDMSNQLDKEDLYYENNYIRRDRM